MGTRIHLNFIRLSIFYFIARIIIIIIMYLFAQGSNICFRTNGQTDRQTDRQTGIVQTRPINEWSHNKLMCICHVCTVF